MNVDSFANHLPELLKAALESAGEAVVVTDLQGTIVYVNPAFERITGWSRGEAVGNNPRMLRSGQVSDELYSELWKTISSGETWRGSFFNRRKDGTQYRVEQTIAPVRTSSGQTIGYVSVHEDVTERVNLENLLRQETEDRLDLLLKEAQAARTIQQLLYPTTAPHVSGFDIAGQTVTASELCGDYFDFISLPSGRLAAVVGDVCGHGIGPALIMTETRAWLRAMLSLEKPLPEVLSRVNDAICPDLPSTMFVTLFVASLNPVTREVDVCGAGHQGWIVRADGRLERLMSSGPFLGVLSNLQFEPRMPFTLDTGDVLMLITDGLIEARTAGGEQFGIERVAEVVRSSSNRTAAQLVAALHASVAQFTQQPTPVDDITIVIVKGE